MIPFWLAIPLDPLPRDVTRFVEQHESCAHFRGEEPYDAARARELERKIARSCRGLARKRARLELKYRRSATVQAVLAEHVLED